MCFSVLFYVLKIKQIYLYSTVIEYCFLLQSTIHVNDRVVPQPPLQKLSAERLTREGAFLMDCGSVSYLFHTSFFSFKRKQSKPVHAVLLKAINSQQ